MKGLNPLYMELRFCSWNVIQSLIFLPFSFFAFLNGFVITTRYGFVCSASSPWCVNETRNVPLPRRDAGDCGPIECLAALTMQNEEISSLNSSVAWSATARCPRKMPRKRCQGKDAWEKMLGKRCLAKDAWEKVPRKRYPGKDAWEKDA